MCVTRVPEIRAMGWVVNVWKGVLSISCVLIIIPRHALPSLSCLHTV